MTHWNPIAQINLSALRHNAGIARRCAPNTKLIGVIKSQAYGHGMVTVANALQDQVNAFAVARLVEALELRESGIKTDILLLEGVNDTAELNSAMQAGLQLVVHHSHQLELLQKTSLPRPLDCWLKLDTGMHRLGFALDQAHTVVRQLLDCKSVKTLRLMTHLANADNPQDNTSKQQIGRIQDFSRQYRLEASIANSAGVLAWSESHADWVRPGVMLYGASPVMGHSVADYGLRPVMHLQARLISIKPIHQGAPVGYGGIWQAPQDMLLGVVGIGYGDGYPRHIQPSAQALLNGQRVSVVGRVSMDMLTLDLRQVPANIGDHVTLWGDGLPINEVADWADTIPYTLMCGLSTRVERCYLEDASACAG